MTTTNTTRFAAQPMAKLNASLITSWDSATQYTTVYMVQGMHRTVTSVAEFDALLGHHATKPVGTLIRARVYSKGPAWTCSDTKGTTMESSKTGLFDSPRSLILRLAVHLINEHEAAQAQAAKEASAILTTETAKAYLLEKQPNALITSTKVIRVDGALAIDIDFRYGLGGHSGNAWVWVQDGKLYGEW